MSNLTHYPLPWYENIFVDEPEPCSWVPKPKVSRVQEFNQMSSAEQLELCLNAITTRKLRGRLWYPYPQYWEQVIIFLLSSGLWEFRWHREGKEAFLQDVEERAIGQGIIVEDLPERILEEWEICDYTVDPDIPKNIRNSVTLLKNWSTTRKLLLRTDFPNVPYRIFFKKGISERCWAMDKLFSLLATLSSKTKNRGEVVWLAVLQQAYFEKQEMRAEQHICGESDPLDLLSDLSVDVKDIEGVLEKYDFAMNDLDLVAVPRTISSTMMLHEQPVSSYVRGTGNLANSAISENASTSSSVEEDSQPTSNGSRNKRRRVE